jgi:ribosomal protein L16/L10AE
MFDMNRDGEPHIDVNKALVPADDTSLSRRSIEVTRRYINRGNSTTRSLWVNIQPRNPILKAVAAVPVAAVMLGMLILMMAIAGFALLTMALMLAKSGKTNQSK